MKPERRLQLQVCQYIKTKYPKVIFWANDSGEKKTIGLAKLVKRMRSGSKIPDLWISEAQGGWAGLYLELKAETPYKKDGTVKANPHLQAQFEMMDRLIDKGYMACFAWSLEGAIATVRNYMNQK